MKDPFYRQIREALDRRLDGELFEACAADLLRERFPTLVPITGGNDGGMDGAIADGEGEAFPLVCTTQERVIDNLARSLESYVRTGGRRRKVVVATSRALSPTSRRDLRDRARRLEFTLVQVYEQRAMAALLYRSSRWRQDLLDLPGRPAALSILPPRLNRPLVELELLGRQEDAEWLRSMSGDRILVGDPGAGKTYLLYQLALEGWGHFLASDDDKHIANAIGDHDPEVIVVVDAHVEVGRLERLTGLRKRTGARFSVVATTWRGHRDDVAAALNVPSTKIHTLEPLPRRQIVRIFEDLGVEAPDQYLLELVDQASNKPGLATTLAALWLESDWLSVLRGEALTRDTLKSVRRLVGRDEEGLLAIFSLGGRRGMPTTRIGEMLNLNVLEMRERLASLSAAGVLSEVGDDCLAVQPRSLRPVLISSVFFAQKGILDYGDFLDVAPVYACAVLEIVTAAARGARISIGELQRLVGRLDPGDDPLRKEAMVAWGTFVGLGHREALWAIDHYPGELADIARPGLDSVPETVIQRLLVQAEAQESQVSSHTHPHLDIISSWLYEITFPMEETLERRRKAIRVARRHAKVADSAAALAAAFRLGCLSLEPTVHGDCIDPTRTGLITRRGPLPQPLLRQMHGVWKDALQLFKITGVVSFPELFIQLEEWMRLSGACSKILEDEKRFIRQFVVEMLRDLVPLAAGRNGLSVALLRLADELSVDLPLDPDPRFEILFPPLSKCLSSASEPLEALAADWADASPADVVETLLHLTQEAESIPLGYYSNVFEICRVLAARAQEPEAWFDALVEKRVPSSWLAPFLNRLSALPSSDDRIRLCLDGDSYPEIGIHSVLSLPEPSPDLLTAALERAVDFPDVVEGMGLRGELSTPVASAALVHPDPALALAAAIGEWMADPKGEVRPELGELWRQAVLRAAELESPNRVESYHLTELLGADPELAFEWLLRLCAKTSRLDSEIRSTARSALGFLGPERRQDLLDRISAGSALTEHLPQLIDRDVELYRRLLRRDNLEEFHLLPLRGLPGPDWAELAKLALRQGFGPEEVARAAYSEQHVWRGTGKEYWRRWDEAFGLLERPAGIDSGWRRMIQHGREYARMHIRDADQRRRRIERDGMVA